MKRAIGKQRGSGPTAATALIVAAIPLAIMVLMATMATMTIMATTPATAVASDAHQKFQDALQGDWGKISFNIRWRFEYVDQEGKGIARGDPIRLRLGYLTPEFINFTAFAEFEGNTPVFVEDYNSTRNGKTEYPVIADPAEAELNQGWLAYSGISQTTLKAGRQKIIYDNHRFVGNVGWRQMEQTFDAAGIVNKSIGNSNLNFAYIWNVRTINSMNVNVKAPVLNLGYTIPAAGKFTAYGYWLDYHDADNSGPSPYLFSTQTYGARFHGAVSFAENFNALYTAEYAYQTNYGDNPADYAANYFHFIGGLKFNKQESALADVTAKIGWESLGSDNGVSLKTPLGTNHAFQGWADKFLVTPPDGITDLYADLGIKLAGILIQGVYHQFDAAEGGSDYGHEIDARVSKSFAKHCGILLAYANYSARDWKTNTEKFWAQFTVSY